MQDMELSRQLGSRIKEKRLDSGLTQSQLAMLLSCDIKHLQSIEQGRRRPSYELLIRISDTLGEPTDFFLQDSCTDSRCEEIRVVDLFNRLSASLKELAIRQMETLLDFNDETK